MITEEQQRKVNELLPRCRWSLVKIIEDVQAIADNADVHIREVHRGQGRQNRLFCQGRDEEEILRLVKYGTISKSTGDILLSIIRNDPSLKDEPIVTWTLTSKHTQRLAADLVPVNITFEELKAIASTYNVTQPLENDLYHHEFDNALRQPVIGTIGAKIRKLQRLMEIKGAQVKQMLSNVLSRLLKRAII